MKLWFAVALLGGCHSVFGLDDDLRPIVSDDNVDPNDVDLADGGSDAGGSDAAALPPGLRAHFLMDSIAANTMIDELHRSDGNCTTCPTLGKRSPHDSSYVFDQLARVTVLDGTQLASPTFTVAFWYFTAPDSVATQCYVDKGAPAGRSAWSVCSTLTDAVTGSFAFSTYDGIDHAATALGPFDQAWHHFAITVATDGQQVMYFDGNQAELTGEMVVPLSDTSRFFIGDNLALGTGIDELVFFDRALTEAEIRTLSTAL